MSVPRFSHIIKNCTIVLVIVSFGFSFNIPRWMEMTTRVVTIRNDNQTTSIHTILDNTDLRKNPYYIKYYIGTVDLCKFSKSVLNLRVFEEGEEEEKERISSF